MRPDIAAAQGKDFLHGELLPFFIFPDRSGVPVFGILGDEGFDASNTVQGER